MDLITEDQLKKILTNPFYCLRQVSYTFQIDHEPIITEDQFIQAGKQFILEHGAEEYIKLLLENLKGNYVPSN